MARSRLLLRPVAGAALALALLAGGYALVAQVAGDRGIAPTAASADIEVRGIRVDVTAASAEEARTQGWHEAVRKAWEQIKGPKLSDSQLDSLVAAIVIEREQLAPRRYLATLGVVFDRQRASAYIGGAQQASRSAPMLLIPVEVSGGAYTTYEQRNAWQRAWAEFNPGGSRIAYVRPSGAGGDSLLINFGQTGRRSRVWWSNMLDQYGAADVLMAFARLESQFPGGPVRGTFTARYGPDSRLLESFTLEAAGPDELAAMLARAVERMDAIFTSALESGKLKPDTSLRIVGTGEMDPAIARLIEIGRAARARAAAEAAAAAAGLPRIEAQPVITAPAPGEVAVRSIVVQFATPDASAFDMILGSVRATPGVRGVGVTSTAIGGTSVMSVSYAGSLEELAAALETRGFAVRRGASALAISR